MQLATRIKFALAATFVSATCQAALVSTTLDNVAIGDALYNITFVQDSDGFTSFSDVFGAVDPSFAFTSAPEALAAITAIRAAVDVADLDVTPADFRNAFALPFALTATDFSYFTAWVDDPIFNGVFGPFTRSRGPEFEVFASYALVERAPASVPEPGSLALLAVGVLGVAGVQRRRGAADRRDNGQA